MKTTIGRVAWSAGLVLLLGGLTTSSAWAELTLDDVFRLKAAGVSEETILSLVEKEEAVFYLSVEEIIALKDVGASDAFIRELLETPDRFGDGGDRRGESSWDDYDFDDYSTVFVYQYYDPFAYYWYPWPGYYVYYSPFWWSHCGFYYGGYWSRDWWYAWSPCASYCDYRYGYHHWCGPSHTRAAVERTWRRAPSAFPERERRERTIWQRAGLTSPRGIVPRANPTWASPTRARTHATPSDRQRPSYRPDDRGRSRRATVPAEGQQAVRRDRSATPRPQDREVERSRPSGSRTERGGSSVQRERSQPSRSAPARKDPDDARTGGSGRTRHR
jgi:hypothetical protein